MRFAREPGRVGEFDEADLPEGSAELDVAYSSLNYKDALSITGKAPIARSFPMVAGIDVAGVVSGSGDWPHEHTAETEALGLPAAERQLLAALAVVGPASLSADELADLGVAPGVIPLPENPERRGLVRLDERRRYSVVRSIGEQLRRTDASLAMGDRLLDRFSTLARNGALTPARLDNDAEAILGVAGWAAEAGRFAGLLELVKTLEAPFGIAQRNFARAERQLFGELFGHVERDRHRPEGAIGEAHVGADAFIILAVHETAQRRESAVHQEFEIAQLASGQIPRGPIFRMAFQFGGVIGRHLQLDEFAPVRGDKVAG